MKKIALGILAFTSMGLIAAETIRQDSLKIGKTAATTKTIEFDTADGASNKKITLDGTSKDLAINTDLLVGDGTSSDQTIFFDEGSVNPPAIKWNDTSGKLQFSNDGSAFQDMGSGSGSGGSSGLNTLENPSFDVNLDSWTASGGTFTQETSDPGFGSGAGKWDAGSASQTLDSSDVTVLGALKGASCVAYAYVSGDASLYDMQVIDGSDAIIAEKDDLGSYSDYTKVLFTFICPESGSIALRFEAQGDGAEIKIDQAFLGGNDQIVNVSQATIYGQVNYEGISSCVWDTTSSFADFSADSDCNTATASGNASAPDTKVPAIKFASLPSGDYEFVASGTFAATDSSSGSQSCSWRFSDGTNSSEAVTVESLQAASDDHTVPTIYGRITYSSTQSNVTIDIQGQRNSGDGNCRLNAAANKDLTITVKRYPIESEEVAKLDSSSLIWQGYHDSTCNWTGTGSSLASFPSDSTCSLTEILNVNMGTVTSQLSSGDPLPGIVFTPKRTGQYEVCASGTHEISSGGNKALLALEYDGSYYDMQGSSAIDGSDQAPFRLCAIINVASLGGTVDVELHGAIQSSSVLINNDPDGEVTGDDRNVNWSIMYISDSFPMISLENSMTSNTTTGQRAYVAKIDGAPTPTIESQAGTWIDSITDNGVGDYTLNFSSDAFSSSPYCLVSNDENADNIVRAYSESTSSVTVRVKDTTPSFVEGDFTIICIGAR